MWLAAATLVSCLWFACKRGPRMHCRSRVGEIIPNISITKAIIVISCQTCICSFVALVFNWGHDSCRFQMHRWSSSLSLWIMCKSLIMMLFVTIIQFSFSWSYHLVGLDSFQSERCVCILLIAHSLFSTRTKAILSLLRDVFVFKIRQHANLSNGLALKESTTTSGWVDLGIYVQVNICVLNYCRFALVKRCQVRLTNRVHLGYWLGNNHFTISATGFNWKYFLCLFRTWNVL